MHNNHCLVGLPEPKKELDKKIVVMVAQGIKSAWDVFLHTQAALCWICAIPRQGTADPGCVLPPKLIGQYQSISLTVCGFLRSLLHS